MNTDTIIKCIKVAEQDNDFELIQELERMLTTNREQAYHDKWQARFDNDTADLY